MSRLRPDVAKKVKVDIPCCVRAVQVVFIFIFFGRFPWETLTCTHSFFVPRLVRAVVAVQSLVVVARVRLVAHLAHLAGARLAAVAAVHQEADAWRTGGGHRRTLAWPLAVLRAVVRLCGGGRDAGGWDAGGRDVGGRDTGGRDVGGRDVGGRDGGGRRHGSGILGVGLRRGKDRRRVNNHVF